MITNETPQPEQRKEYLKSIREAALAYSELNSLRSLAKMYYRYQEERMAIDGIIERKKNGEKKANAREQDDEVLLTLTKRREEVEDQENIFERAISIQVHKHPIWTEFLSDIKGCGETTAAVILTEFDINKSQTVSNMWSFAGLAPGKDRKQKGIKCPYNQFLRAKLCGVLGSSFLKCKSPYSEYYYNMRHRFESENWGKENPKSAKKENPKAWHQHKAATRYMIKMFLKDLYVAWRTIEGLPVREPYQVEYLGKAHH